MVMTDPIVDYLTRIKNANMTKHSSVEISASLMKKSLSETLKNEGSIRDYQVEDDSKRGMVKILLKYDPNNERVTPSLKRTSKPGLRNCVSVENLSKILNGPGIAIISTSVGVITDKETREKNIGGEVIAYVW